MTANVVACEPTQITAGDTVAWTFDTAHSAVPGGQLSYSFTGINVLRWNPAWVTFTGTVASVSVPGSATAQLGAGPYRVMRHIADGNGNRYSTPLPMLTVAGDPAQSDGGDDVPWLVQALANIRECITGQASMGAQMYMVAGRQLMNWPPDQLMNLESRLQRRLDLLTNGGRARVHFVTFQHSGPPPTSRTFVPGYL